MAIQYVLHKNPITPDPDDCRSIVVNTQIFNVDDVVKQITGEGSILKETESVAVSNALLRQIGLNLSQGIGFHCDYFDVSIDMRGVYMNENDTYDPKRHTIYANLRAGKPWKENLAKAKVEKVTPDENKPGIVVLFDLKSKTANETLTPGGMAEIQGQLLKVDATANDEGIFFVSENGGDETKVAYIYQNFPKSIQFEIPDDLAPGNYRLEVRNRPHHGKTIRKGTLENSLTVA